MEIFLRRGIRLSPAAGLSHGPRAVIRQPAGAAIAAAKQRRQRCLPRIESPSVGYAPVHSVDQWVFKDDQKPRLCSSTSYMTSYMYDNFAHIRQTLRATPRDGRWSYRSALVSCRYCRLVGSRRVENKFFLSVVVQIRVAGFHIRSSTSSYSDGTWEA